MQNNKKLFIVCIITLLHFQALAQKQLFSKLELKPGEEFIVAPGNILIVDTLVLQNNSTLRFLSDKDGILGVRIAYVGEGCTITSKGADGQLGKFNQDGTSGEDGGNLEIDIHFMKLGSLTIDTRGGTGGNGHLGKHGSKPYSKTSSYTTADGKGGFKEVSYTVPVSSGSNGEKGTSGGAGGNGGNIKLTHSTNNFIINFNQSPRTNQNTIAYTIEILYKAGREGKAGRDGNSYVGSTIIRGIPVSNNHQPKQDGHIEMVNANNL